MEIFYIAAIERGLPDAANRHTFAVCRRLSKMGHNLHVFIPGKDTSDISCQGNLKIISVPVPEGLHPVLKTFWFYIRLPFSAFPFFKKLCPSVVYTRMNFLEWMAMVPLRKFFRFCYVAELNGLRSIETQPGSLRRAVISRMELQCLQAWDRVVAVTPELARWAARPGGLPSKSVAVIGNGVSTGQYVPIAVQKARQALELKPDSCYLNFTGTLKPWHDIETVIRAMPAIIRSLHCPVMLMVVGDGPERARLMKMARQVGVYDSIAWIGQVSARKVTLYINAADICLAPFTIRRNITTGICPLKVLEYMSCSRPFVMSRLGTAFDKMVSEQQCGYLVPPDNPGMLSQAVLELMGDTDMRKQLGEKGRMAATRFFGWDSVVERIQQFIQ